MRLWKREDAENSEETKKFRKFELELIENVSVRGLISSLHDII